MMKKLLALLLVGCAPSIQHVRDPVVSIQRDGASVCSGFAISETQIATAAHCVADGPVRIVTRDQWERTSDAYVEADVLYVNTERDMAVLSSSARFSFPLRLREPVVGESVTAVSATYGWQYSDGFVMPSFGYFADSTISIRDGWSGSPVIASDGRAVGFVSQCMATWDGAVPTCLPHSAIFAVLP